MWTTLLVPLVIAALHADRNAATSNALGTDPEVYMDTTQMITSKGYPCENHWVTTKDGYILNFQRIPHGLKNKNTTKGPKPVIFLQHGLLGSATHFLDNLANESLAYILADAGADVWLGNSRGNTYSKNHTTLSPTQLKFWTFSWDDMAKYDLPASIDYVRNVSGQDKIFYAGHSQGTTIGFAGFSENQEMASHIKHFFALAPVARISHAKTPIVLLAPYANAINIFLDLFGKGQFDVPPKILTELATGLCTTHTVLCENIVFLLSGPDSASLNQTRLPVYLSHTPSPTSSLNVLQWAQLYRSNKFQKFDHGPIGNLERYGQIEPPQYDPSKMKVPVSLFTGGMDYLATPKDVAWLIPQIKPNLYQHVDIKRYAHLDFIWGVDAAPLIYKYIVKTVLSKSV